MRAGYGASTLPFPDNRYAFNFPVKQNNPGSAANGFQPAGSMATGFPAPGFVNIPTNGVIPATGTLRNAHLRRHPDRLHEATLHSWNVAFQRQLPWNLTAEVAYVGNRGVRHRDGRRHQRGHGARLGQRGPAAVCAVQPHRHEPHAHQRRQDGIPRDAGEGGPPLQERPAGHQLVHAGPRLGLREREHQHQPRRWTSSKSWARSDFDRLHNYVLNAIYELPWGPGKKWLGEGLAGKIIGGWQLSGLLHGAVGPSAEHHRQQHAVQHARQHRVSQPHRIEHACSAASGPASCTSIRPSTPCQRPACRATCAATRGPKAPASGRSTWRSSSGSRGGGSRFAEFRMDAFNVTNSLRWDNPNTGFSTAAGNTFGQITSITGGRHREPAVRRTVRLLN